MKKPVYNANSRVDAVINSSHDEIAMRDQVAWRRERKDHQFAEVNPSRNDSVKRVCPKCAAYPQFKNNLANSRKELKVWIHCRRCGPLSKPYPTRADAMAAWDAHI